MDAAAEVDAYVAALPEPHRGLLTHLRLLIREARPDAVEVISYRMPGFRLHGRLLLSYASYRRHCAVYPASAMAIDALGAALAPFVTEKATLRFTADRPLPDDLVRRFVEVRAAEVAGDGAAR